jgi:voltage-gated potassium channel
VKDKKIQPLETIKDMLDAPAVSELVQMRDRLFSVVGAVITALIFGTLGYQLIEGWSFADALYMTVITLATVGYGETHPLTPEGRIFTIIFILGGVAIVTYAFSTLTAVIVEGHLSQALERRRMQKEIDKLSDHYIVCGAGHAGAVIIEELRKTKRPVVVVEKTKEIADRLMQEGIFVVEGDATDDDTLRRAGVERAVGVFAVLSTDQNNAFVALTAKGLNPRLRVVAAQKELGVREKLIRSGADNVVNPEFIGGLRMASEMIRPATTGFLDSMIREKGNAVRFDEAAIPLGSKYVGKTLGNVKAFETRGAMLIAVMDATGKYEINPDPARTLRAGERLVMLGDADHISELRRTLSAT